MPQPKQDILKTHLRQWMLDNADTYDAFEKMMNEQSTEGYQQIMFSVISHFPKFEKIIDKKIQSKKSENISSIEDFLAEEKLGTKFLEQLHMDESQVNLPVMLSWLYFGRSFENMVERGEELLENNQTTRFYKSLVSKTIKLLIKKSKELGLRTEQDWIEYRELQTAIKNDNVLDWAMSIDDTNPKETKSLPQQKKNSKIAFDDMIFLPDEEKIVLISKIAEYLGKETIGKNVAFMITALRQLGYLPKTTTDRQLFYAIKEKFNVYIGSDKSIYNYLDDATAKQFQTEIDTLKTYFQVK